MNKIVMIDESLCIGCGACVSLCPKKSYIWMQKAENAR